MKKFLVSAALIISAATPLTAGGLLTNTNQNAVFLRNPARDAIIGIDGVYSNPAGVAFMPQGFHLSLSWQAAWQKRQITSTAPFYMLNTNNPSATREFEGKATAPVIPSFQAAYVINDKWSVAAQFAVGGGGGKCDFATGLPMFEQLVGGSLASGIHNAMHPAATTPYTYTLQQNLVGRQYMYGIQVGATYRVLKNLSVFAGVRGVIARSGYEGAVTGYTVNGIPGTMLSSKFADQAQQAAAAAKQFAEAGIADKAAEYAALAQQAGTVALMTQSDLTLDCSQRGLGITPIVGVDYKLGRLNLAAKYEFRTKISMENESNNSDNVDKAFADYADGKTVRSDIPALLTVGAQYSFAKGVRTMAGFHYFFDKDAKGAATNVDKNTWEVTAGVEWDITDKFMVSLGAQRTQYGFDDQGMTDTNFNISSTGLCLGASYRVNKMVNINAGYMHSFYDEHEINRGNGITDLYTRKNDVVGVSVDLTF